MYGRLRVRLKLPSSNGKFISKMISPERKGIRQGAISLTPLYNDRTESSQNAAPDKFCFPRFRSIVIILCGRSPFE